MFHFCLYKGGMAKRKSKQELDSAREIAYMLYVGHVSCKEISERVGVSMQSLSKWIADGMWKEKRAAKTITRVELINKTLMQINDLLEKKSDDGESDINADKLSKLVAMVEKLDKKASPITAMEVFIDFVSWIQKMSVSDKTVTVELIKTINRYQDAYITTLMTAK